MLLMVFGAGASFDSVDESAHPSGSPYRPPLANDLFAARYEPFYGSLQAEFVGILHRLRGLFDGISLEEVLEKVSVEGESYPRRRGQLVGVRYYLQHLLRDCGDKWAQAAQHATNYAALFDQVDEWRHSVDEQVAIVTFNYDLMVESALNALFGLSYSAIDDWASSERNYRVFKLHGSCNWTHPTMVKGTLDPNAGDLIGAAQRGDLTIDDDRFTVVERSADMSTRGDVYPALAIPVLTKNTFVCPTTHVEELKRMLPEVDRVLIIGWRGSEQAFVDLASSTIDGGSVKRLWVVAESQESATQTVGSLRSLDVDAVRIGAISGGFTQIVKGNAIRDFLHVER